MKEKEKESAADEFIAEHETSFDPTQYEIPVETLRKEERKRSGETETTIPSTTAAPETTSGYRVQVLMTQDIDKANSVRDSLISHLPDEWTYIVYDAPYYKVRVGNFADRPRGNRMLEQLIRLGFEDAWVVPDLIVTHPPAHSAPPPPEEPKNEEYGDHR